MHISTKKVEKHCSSFFHLQCSFHARPVIVLDDLGPMNHLMASGLSSGPMRMELKTTNDTAFLRSFCQATGHLELKAFGVYFPQFL